MKIQSFLIGLVFLALVPATFATTTNWVVVDHHERPLPGEPPAGWFYNEVGGDRGLLYDTRSGLFTISKPTDSSYQFHVNGLVGGGSWTSCGGWYALARCRSNWPSLSPTNLLHPIILPRYQCKLTGVELIVNRIQSPSGLSSLSLSLQLKGFNSSHQEVLQWQNTWSGRSALLSTNYPASFFAAINPTNLPNIGMVLWILDKASGGDTIEVDAVRLRVEGPTLTTELEALLWSLSHLLYNFDAASGMVGDRCNFPDRVDENVTATGKLAKLLALAIQLDLVDTNQAKAAVLKIADTLLNRVPRGPAGVNTLWPHFTLNGGTQMLATEWASGDTAYAATDLMVALKLIGDPSNQLAQAESFLQTIDWRALQAPNGGFYHGYSNNTRLPGIWFGFGAETFGVLLAAQTAGVRGEMGAPPSDNGSGFILHAAYPIPLAGMDRWTNNWLTLRTNEVQAQLNWYCDPAHSNAFFCTNRWFGLSAGECPAGWDPDTNRIYQAYGIGGQHSPPNDGSNSVVVLHYSGMISSLQPVPAKRMWESMRSFGLISPLNNVESISVWPSTGATTNNSLKGSWNLALQTEGWMLSMPGASAVLYDAFRSITNLAAAYDAIFPPPPPAPDLLRAEGGVKVLSQGKLPNEHLSSVAFGSGGFVAVGIGGRVLRSTDGRAWVPEYSGITNALNAVAFADRQYVAVGNQGSILRSSDGFFWVPATSGTTTNLNSVVRGSDNWLAVGDRGIALTSSNAVTWTASNTGVTNQLLQASFGAGRFIVAGGVLLSSTNALNWFVIPQTNLPGSLSTSFKAATYGGETFVAMAEVQWPAYSVAYILVSPDASDWTYVGIGYTHATAAQKLRFVGGLFAVFDNAMGVIDGSTVNGFEQSMNTSWDGFVWNVTGFWLSYGYEWSQQASVDYGYQLQDNAFGNGIFVAVGRESLLRGVISPAFTRAGVSNGGFTALLRGEPGVVYEIQTSTNLANWDTLTNVSHSSGRIDVTNTTGLSPHRFYRARRQTEP